MNLEYHPGVCKLYVAWFRPNNVKTFEILSDYTGALRESFVCCTEFHMRGHVKYQDLHLKQAPKRGTFGNTDISLQSTLILILL